ncbi:MAG TPA: hypothetical protein VMF08_16190 [Candidatus Sulfotelmatobacter sp.]|nr:hypothetical protein [Candidatus Sulfotelmatobacter sp.]
MKKNQLLVCLVSSVAIAGFSGCAPKSSDSSSQPAQPAMADASTNAPAAKKPKDKRPIEQRLVVGMTMDQVKEACGNPKNVAMNSDGSATWMYNDSEKAFIPNYTLFGGRIHYVTVIFGPDGKVRSWSSGSNGMY